MIYGIVFSFCLYKNLSGITFPFFVVSTIIVFLLFLKKAGFKRKKYIWLYFGGMLLLGISSVLTANGFFLFFNWAGILILLATALLYQFFEESQSSFILYISRVFSLIGNTLISLLKPFSHMFDYAKRSEDGKKKNIFAALAGILIACGFLLVVFPLLIQSDRVFDNIVSDFIEMIRIADIFGVIFTGLLG